MLRARFKQSVYLIEEIATGLCLREPHPQSNDESAQKPTITSRAIATAYLTREAAEEAFARLLGAAPFEIVRADA